MGKNKENINNNGEELHIIDVNPGIEMDEADKAILEEKARIGGAKKEGNWFKRLPLWAKIAIGVGGAAAAGAVIFILVEVFGMDESTAEALVETSAEPQKLIEGSLEKEIDGTGSMIVDAVMNDNV